MLRNYLAFFVFSLSLMGCATTYRPMGFDGGYADEIADYEYYLQSSRESILKDYGHDILFKVTFKGNSDTSEEQVEAMLLGRCGEISLNNNANYFYVIDSGGSVKNRYSSYTYSTGYTAGGVSSSYTKWAVIIISVNIIDGWEYPYNASRYFDAIKPKAERDKNE